MENKNLSPDTGWSMLNIGLAKKFVPTWLAIPILFCSYGSCFFSRACSHLQFSQVALAELLSYRIYIRCHLFSTLLRIFHSNQVYVLFCFNVTLLRHILHIT